MLERQVGVAWLERAPAPDALAAVALENAARALLCVSLLRDPTGEPVHFIRQVRTSPPARRPRRSSGADVALHIAKPSRAGGGSDRDGLTSEVRLRVEPILKLACDHLHMDVAFLGELVDGHQVLRAVHGDGTGFGVQTGTELPLSKTLRDGW